MGVKGNLRSSGAGTSASARLQPPALPIDDARDGADRAERVRTNGHVRQPRKTAAHGAAPALIRADLRARVDALTADLRTTQTALVVARADLAAARTDLQMAQAERQASEQRARDHARHAAALQAALDAVVRSRSWRLTAPLRLTRLQLRAWRIRTARAWRQQLGGAGGGGGAGTAVPDGVPAALTTWCSADGGDGAVAPRDLRDAGTHVGVVDDTAVDHVNAGANVDTNAAAAAVVDIDTDAVAAHLQRGLALPACEAPLVSVIIPVHGQLADTLHCLRSIVRHWPHAATEVLVVDDASPDRTAETLACVPGVRLLRRSSNEGFIHACNDGARAARGRYLLFLNNDTEVLHGWCDELIATFDADPRAGIVGARLLYPGGRLQEAGGLIWQDGSGWNYGRGDDPERPEYSYRREVDYVSGAALAMPRTLFRRLGGFDERYLPAYGEDSDLAFKVRDAGLAVVYQPMARVIHREGGTAGTDPTRGVKAHQTDNARRLFTRWQPRLAARPRPGTDLLRARERGVTRRVLVIDHCTPEPDKDAGSITARNIMRLLQRLGWKVSFIPEDNFLFLDRYTPDLQRLGVECHYAPYTASVDEHLRAQGGLYDLVLIFRFTAARRHLATVRRWCPTAKVIVHTSDLHFLRETREAELRRDLSLLERAEQTRLEELAVIRAADGAIVHSPVEQDLLRTECPGARVSLFGWAIDVPGTRAVFDTRRDLVFVGGYQHVPNVDAVRFFVQEVMPLLRLRLPGLTFYAIGSHPPDELRALAASDVVVSGFVPDLGARLDRMRVAVAPLRYGAGIKGKVLTTMSHGLPGVVTTVAAEGLGLTAGEHVLIADEPRAIADAVVTLYTDRDRWTRLSQAGLAIVRERFGFETGLPIVQRLLDDVGLRPLAASPATEVSGIPWREWDVTRVAGAQDYRAHLTADAGRIAERARIESSLCPHGTAPFHVDGECVACHAPARFRVGYEYSVAAPDGEPRPNWREQLICECGLNARIRLALHVLMHECGVSFDDPLYLMEQAGPLYRWLARRAPALVGSEFLGDAVAGGSVIDGVRHEDVTRLSFRDAAFSQILSFDVFEHVPDYRRAFAECARCLRPGGRLLFTVPFLTHSASTVVRARLMPDGSVAHLLPPEYHGDPRHDGGILCFQHFGWDMLDDLRSAGFQSAEALFVWSRRFGYLGGEQVIFEAIR